MSIHFKEFVSVPLVSLRIDPLPKFLRIVNKELSQLIMEK